MMIIVAFEKNFQKTSNEIAVFKIGYFSHKNLDKQLLSPKENQFISTINQQSATWIPLVCIKIWLFSKQILDKAVNSEMLFNFRHLSVQVSDCLQYLLFWRDHSSQNWTISMLLNFGHLIVHCNFLSVTHLITDQVLRCLTFVI